jgi:hypothetical protein
MKKLLLIINLVFVLIVNAQDKMIQSLKDDSQKSISKDASDTIPEIWKTGGIFSVNLSQGSLNNWAAGGENFSLSVNTFINVHAFYKKDRYSWDNNLDVNLGYVKTTSLGTRKNDDRFDLTSKYGYALSPKVNVSGLVNLRSQFFKGYNYPDAATKIYTSKFFAPAYLLLSPGIDFHPTGNLSIFVSPATARFIIVSDTSLSKLYGVDAGKKTDFQFGAYTSITYTANLGQVLTYKGKLDLFSNYKSKPQNVDLYMTNLFAAKISKIISATYSLTFIYDDDVRLFGANKTSPGLQLQSLFGAGLLMKF